MHVCRFGLFYMVKNRNAFSSVYFNCLVCQYFIANVDMILIIKHSDFCSSRENSLTSFNVMQKQQNNHSVL